MNSKEKAFDFELRKLLKKFDVNMYGWDSYADDPTIEVESNNQHNVFDITYKGKLNEDY